LRISQTHIEYFLENFDSLIVELFIDARLDLDRWWLRNLIKLDILKFAFQDLVKYLEIIIGLLDLQCWQNHLLPARGIQSNVDLNIVLDIGNDHIPSAEINDLDSNVIGVGFNHELLLRHLSFGEQFLIQLQLIIDLGILLLVEQIGGCFSLVLQVLGIGLKPIIEVRNVVGRSLRNLHRQLSICSRATCFRVLVLSGLGII
jgi:hypothetical protein